MRCKKYLHVERLPFAVLPLNADQRFPLLLLHRLFHAEGVGHQLQVAQNLWLFSLDVAFDCGVGQQLGQVALGHLIGLIIKNLMGEHHLYLIIRA